MDKKTIAIVAIITKRAIVDQPKHIRLVKALVKYLKEHDKEVLLDTNASRLFKNATGHKKEYLLKMADLALTLGGDGTLLKTARRISRKKTFILGVNLGTLGFLTECTPDKLFDCLDTIFAGRYHVDKRAVLRTTVYRNGKKIKTFLALNDAVINQGSFARLIKMDLELDSRKLVRFEADGIIVSTPTGSTAHSLSAGGPIVHPNVDSLIITPICPRSLSMRPIVVPDKKMLNITIATQRREDSANIGLTIDGQDVIDLKFDDQIKIRRSKRSFHLLRVKNRYYRMLRAKLNWGDI